MSPFRCISSLGCAELSLEETLALAAKHHVPLVELRGLGGALDLPEYFRTHFGTPANLAARLRHTPARVVVLNGSLRLVGGSEADREQLVACAPWAEAADIRWLRVFDGGTNMNAAELTAAREALAWWSDLRQRHGWQVDLMVETHDSLFTTERLGRFREAFPGAPILWDAHHTWRKGGEDPVVTWSAIGPAVVHIHVKDSIPAPSARHPYTYVLPGDGGFPARALLDVLSADRFDGPVSLEWERQWHPYLPPLAEALTVAAARRWW